MSQGEHGTRSGERLASARRTALTIFLTSAITSAIAHAGWLDSFETAWLDTWIRLQPRAGQDNVVIVAISDEDYEARFAGSSPLDRRELARVLTAISAGSPAVIGVDLDTDPMEVIRAAGADAASWPPVVWAAVPGGISGDIDPAHLPPVDLGLAAFPQDRDGLIRRYRRTDPRYVVNGKPLATLPWALVQTYCQQTASGAPAACARLSADLHERELILNFAGDRFALRHISVDSLMKGAVGEAWGTAQGPLFGRIALLGGNYEAGRDWHVTPLGPMAGVDVVGQAIESDLRGGGVRAVNGALMFSMEILGGIVIALLHHGLSVRRAFYASLLVIPLLALGSSFVSFYSFSRWASFAPVLLGVLVHELYEGARHQDRAPLSSPTST